jgi:hypothetical protein
MTGPTSSDADPLKALLKRKGAKWRTFAVPTAKVMFVQVNKNACTSLKWMMAGIAGEDLSVFEPSLAASTGAYDEIHNRRAWQNSPMLDELDPDIRSQIHPSNGWFVFAVIRDPRARLFSAWQSKLLLENPGYTSHQTQPWYPRHPADAKSVTEDFAAFVDLLEREPNHRIRGDAHFRDQVVLLYADVVTYTEIYDIREVGRLLGDLRHHLDQQGWTGELNLPRLNDTPLRPNAQPFVDGIRERVEKIYAADFDRFGDRWDFSTLEAAPEWTAADLAEADWRADFGRRIGYLRNQALTFRAEAAAEQKRADAEQARADKLQRRLIKKNAATATPRPRRLVTKLRQLAGVAARTGRRT